MKRWKSAVIDYSRLSERELVDRAQAIDSVAYDVLVDRYNQRICTYIARMIGDDETGRDLAQETFIKAWQALPSLQGDKMFQAWLYRIATNTAKDYLRRKQLIQWLPWEKHEEFIADAMSVAGPEDGIADRDFLKFALIQIPFKYRHCVILQIIEERPQREIAALLGISERSVSTYVNRGLEHLRRFYFSVEN